MFSNIYDDLTGFDVFGSIRTTQNMNLLKVKLLSLNKKNHHMVRTITWQKIVFWKRQSLIVTSNYPMLSVYIKINEIY